jgi:hypothetical protein
MLLVGLRTPRDAPTVIYQDKTAAIASSKNALSSSRLRHRTRYLQYRDAVSQMATSQPRILSNLEPRRSIRLQTDQSLSYHRNEVWTSNNLTQFKISFHNNVRLHNIRELVSTQQVRPVQCSTTDQYADMCTKPLAIAAHTRYTEITHGESFCNPIFPILPSASS